MINNTNTSSTKTYQRFQLLNSGILSCCCSIIYFSLVEANNKSAIINPTTSPTANFLKTNVRRMPNINPTAIPIPPLFVLFAIRYLGRNRRSDRLL